MKLVILDRDGTINEDRDDFEKSADEWVPVPGALEAIARLNHAGWHTVIASNQSGLARGLFDMAALNAIHARMNRELAEVGGRIDAIFFCPHGPDDGCRCRKPLPGALEAIAKLNHAGWHTVLATNQSGLGRGLFDMAMLNAMHARMNQMLSRQGGRIDAVFFCPHAPEDQCDCRKPLPGLMLQIGERYGVNLKDVPLVGDSLRDLQAGVSVGCKPHFVQTGKAGRLDSAELAAVQSAVPGTRIHADLGAFVQELLHDERIERGDAAEPDSVFGAL